MRKGARGFTLIEIMIALAIFSIGMLAVMPLVISSYRIDTQTAYRVRAQYSVTQRLDNLISQSTLTCGGAATTDFIDAQTGQVYATLALVPGVAITRTWTVGAVGVGCTLPNLCLLTVTSTYTDQGGAKTVTASSCKGR